MSLSTEKKKGSKKLGLYKVWKLMVNSFTLKTNKQNVIKLGKHKTTDSYVFPVEGNSTNQQPLVQKQYNLCGFIQIPGS